MSDWENAMKGIYTPEMKRQGIRKLIGQLDSNIGYVHSVKTFFWPAVATYYEDQTNEAVFLEASIAWAADAWLRARTYCDDPAILPGTPSENARGEVGKAEDRLVRAMRAWMDANPI